MGAGIESGYFKHTTLGMETSSSQQILGTYRQKAEGLEDGCVSTAGDRNTTSGIL